MTPRSGNWMQTASGRIYWPVAPAPEDVSIDDIAHHLSMLCRFTGACSRFYSIAEHSVLVSRLVPPELALVGLLHDATEAYLNDINRPVKKGPHMSGYRLLEERNWKAIAEHFGLPEQMPDAIHVADRHALFHEQVALMPPEPEGMDWGMGLERPAQLHPEYIVGYMPEEAKCRFLRRFADLYKARQP